MAIYVLRSSDGVDIEAWTLYTPSVCLATLTVVANAFVAYALVDGLVISFWRHMLAGGTVSLATSIWKTLT